MELATASGRSSRYEKSLGVLATRFVRLLQEARDGVLDLKVAADSLAVRQKRRIYDITNVLEGVGLIEKKNKNVIQWRGKNMAGQTREAVEQLETLKAQMSVLEVQERELDQQKAWLEQSIEHLCNDPSTSAYTFVTHDDICSAFRGDTLLAVMAPSGTQLEVPLPEMGAACQKKYQVTLRSQTAPIHVVLINKESASSRPVVFSVPPADDVSAMPTPPSTPASLQRLPLSSSTAFSISTSDLASSYSSSQDSLCADHQQMALSQHDNVLALSSPPDLQMECHHIQPLSAPQAALAGQELHSMLDMSSLLKLSSTADHMKEEREGVADLIDELMSTDGVDYSFNLDDSEGVSDLFDVQILNY